MINPDNTIETGFEKILNRLKNHINDNELSALSTTLAYLEHDTEQGVIIYEIYFTNEIDLSRMFAYLVLDNNDKKLKLPPIKVIHRAAFHMKDMHVIQSHMQEMIHSYLSNLKFPAPTTRLKFK